MEDSVKIVLLVVVVEENSLVTEAEYSDDLADAYWLVTEDDAWPVVGPLSSSTESIAGHWVDRVSSPF
jgi:hypothetical protein